MVTNKMIRTEEDYRAAMDRIDVIFDASADSPEGEELDLLVHLVEVYEAERYPIPLPDPIAAIEFRMEQQGLSQRDLIPYIGSRPKVSEVLSGKRSISMSMARALHKHLGISADVLLQETGTTFEDTETFEDLYEGLAFERFPLTEMVNREWVKGDLKHYKPYKDHAEELVRILWGRAGNPPVSMNALYRRNEHRRVNPKTDRYALQAWCWQVLATANENPPFKPYREGAVDLNFLNNVAKLSPLENGPLKAKEFLAEHGIALVIEKHLPRTHLDGATLWSVDDRPVVGMTLRYDRIDNFWFTLLHELAHVGWHQGTTKNEFVDDMSLRKPKRSADVNVETEADDWAERALIPNEIWESSRVRNSPRPMNVINLANELNVHPAVVAGRVRYERDNYRLLSQFVGNREVRKHFENAGTQNANVRSKS